MIKVRYLKDRGFQLLVIAAFAIPYLAILQIGVVSIISSIQVIASEGLAIFLEPPGLPGAGRIGGLGPILLNTAIITFTALVFAAPIGIVVGVYLFEKHSSKLAVFVSNAVQMLSEMPSIITGLFVFTVVCLQMKSYSLLAGAMSLGLTALPYIVTQVRESLSSIPPSYLEAAYSLGLSRWKTVWLVLVPMSKTGIASSLLLGYMRTLGETAPVLLTAGFALYSFYGFFGPGNTISLLIYRFAQTPYENYKLLAWTGAAILLFGSFILSYIVRKMVGEVRFL